MVGPVAVIIPAMDAAATIGRAVRSALAQSCAAEVVVVDDGSTDNTAEIASACDDATGRLRVLRQPNRGPSAAINIGQAQTSAPYWCILDADDFFLPTRLEDLFAGAGQDWDLAADRLLLTGVGTEDGPYELWQGAFPPDNVLTFETFVRGCVTNPKRPRTELGYLQPVFRRAFLDLHGLLHDETLRLAEDYMMYSNALAAGARFRLAESPGYVIVTHPTSLSHRQSTEDLAALLRAEARLGHGHQLPKNDRRALAAHMAETRRKLLYRRALDLKADGSPLAALATLIVSPDALAYSLQQSAKARLARLKTGAINASSRRRPGPVVDAAGP